MKKISMLIMAASISSLMAFSSAFAVKIGSGNPGTTYPFVSFFGGPGSCQQMVQLMGNICPKGLYYNLSSQKYGEGQLYCIYSHTSGWSGSLNVGSVGYFTCVE